MVYITREKMRILVDLSDAQIEALDLMAEGKQRSRASLIREAVHEFLTHRRRQEIGDAFGLWGKREIDGLIYQKKIRSEW